VEPRFVEAGGLRFAYLEQGDGPLVLLIHGFPDTAYTWDRALPALAEAGYRAVAPFTRGYHPTAVPASGSYDSATLAQDVLAWIEALGGGPAIVIGHDWGAIAAYGAATLAPEKIRLLVTLAIPHPAAIRPSPRLAWAARHFVTLRRRNAGEIVRANDFAYVDELWRRWSPSWTNLPASETAHVKAALRPPGAAEAACAYYRALGRPPASLRKRITVPAVAFAGEHDIIAPRVYEKARHYFESSYEVVQTPGGHFLHREHPGHVIPELVRVIDDHVARGR